jgi:glucan biosynthesis protein C
MEAFMLLAGIVATLSAKRRGHGWLKRRVVILLIPFIFGCLVLNPVTHYLIDQANDTDGFARNYFTDHWRPGGWHLHLWFLLTLAALSPLSIAVVRLDSGFYKTLDHMISKLSMNRHFLFLALMIIVSVGLLAARAVRHSNIVPDEIDFVVWTILKYAPFYIIGAAMALNMTLFASVTKLYVPLLVISVPMVFITAAENIGSLQQVPRTLYVIMDNVIGLALVNVLLVLFIKIRNVGNLVKGFVESAYTIYLVHYLLVATAILMLSESGVVSFGAYVLIVTFALSVGYVFHRVIVSKSRLARFLFNGQTSKLPASASHT